MAVFSPSPKQLEIAIIGIIIPFRRGGVMV